MRQRRVCCWGCKLLAIRRQSTATAATKDNAIIVSNIKPKQAVRQGSLSKFSFAVKDNICMREGYTTCASAMLRNYVSPIDATCVQLIQGAGATVIGKSNLDEFGMGTTTTNSIHGPTILADGLSAGGSSGGSAVAVKAGIVNAALGTDTGGSVRLPAAYCGIVGFKPSYGRISRFGVIPYANSLDTVGIMTNTVVDAKEIFSVLDKYDPMDPTSLDIETRAKIRTKAKGERLVIGIAEEFLPASIQQAVIDTFRSTCAALQNTVEFRFVSLPSVRNALSAYYITALAEASSNLSKYDGVRYGSLMSDTPDYAAARGAGFGKEVKRRIVLGTFSLLSDSIDNYYLRAAKIRRLLQQEFDAVFAFPNPLREVYDAPSDGVDALLTPVTLSKSLPLAEAVQLKSPTDIYKQDILTVPSSLAGLPSISVPVGIDKIGMQLIGQYGADNGLLDIAELLEQNLQNYA